MSHSPGIRADATEPGKTGLEPVSVVMPVRNEELTLAEAVRSVRGQDYPGDLEVVLAVGPSRDQTLQVSERIAAGDPRVTVVPNPAGHIPSAVNAAIKASRHSIVARVDGHALLPQGYLRTAVAELRRTGAANVGGIMAAEGVSRFQQAVAWAMTSPYVLGAAKFHTGGGPGPVDSVYLGVYRRVAIEQVGGYDETYLRAEDWELNHRIRLAGGVVWFQPELRVTYRTRASVRMLAAQYFHYGRWRGVLAAIAGLGGLLSGTAGVWPAILTCGFAIPALYVAGVIGVGALAVRHLRLGVAARVPGVLAAMHIAWGAGFLTSPRSLIPGNRAMSEPAGPG